MGEEVVAFRIGLPAAWAKFGKALVHADMEEGFHIEGGFAKAVHASQGSAADPLVVGGYASTEPWHSSGDFGSGRMAAGGAEQLAEGACGCA